MKEGHWGACGGLKYCFLTGNGTVLTTSGEQKAATNRIMVSVPKKFFKRAVKRNLLKRRLRESYRKQKSIIGDIPCGVDVMFQYNTADILSYDYIYALVGKILESIASKQ